MDTIGSRLKNAIKNSNFTQKEIAELINTSTTTLSTYTQNKSSIPIEALIKICELIKIPLNEIVYGVDESNINEVLISKFNKLTDEQKDRIMEQIEFYENKNDKMSHTSVNTRDVNEEKNRTG